MTATATIHLPKRVHEWTTAEALRGVRYIHTAYMVGRNLIKIEYNPRRLSVPDIYKYVKQNQKPRAMIAYKVKHIRLVLDATPQTMKRAGITTLNNDDRALELLREAISGDMDLILGKTYRSGFLTVEHLSEKTFKEGAPIENRRAALDYANELCRIILETKEWYDARGFATAAVALGFNGLIKLVQEQMNGYSKLFNTLVYAVIDGQEKKIASILQASEEVLSNWAEELSHYENQGHDIGGEEPHTHYIYELGRIVRVLPDVAPLLK